MQIREREKQQAFLTNGKGIMLNQLSLSDRIQCTILVNSSPTELGIPILQARKGSCTHSQECRQSEDR